MFDALTKAGVWIDDRIVDHYEVKRVKSLTNLSTIEVLIDGSQQRAKTIRKQKLDGRSKERRNGSSSRAAGKTKTLV